MEAAVLCETARLHLKPVAQTSSFEMPVASAVYSCSSVCIFMGLLFDDDDEDDSLNYHYPHHRSHRHRHRSRHHLPKNCVDR